MEGGLSSSSSSSRVAASFAISSFLCKEDSPLGATEPTSVLDARIPSPTSTRSSSCEGTGVLSDSAALSVWKSAVDHDHLTSTVLVPPSCALEENGIWLQNGNDGLLEDIAGISSYAQTKDPAHAAFSATLLSQSDSFLTSSYGTELNFNPFHDTELPPLKRRNISECALSSVLPSGTPTFAGYSSNGVDEAILNSPASFYSFHSPLPSICSPHQEYCRLPTTEDRPSWPAVEMQRFWMMQKPQTQPLLLQQEVIIEKLVEAVEAVQVGNYALTQVILARLNHLSPMLLPAGNPPLLRVAFYLKEALMNHLGSPSTDYSSPLQLFQMINAFKELCQYSPIPTFGYLACNQAILESLHGQQNIHILDFFPGGVGLQWVSFLHDVAALWRGSARLNLRITMVGSLHQSLEMQLSGEELSQLGTHLDLSLEMKTVTISPDFDSDSLQSVLDIRDGEAVAINFGNGVNQVYSEFACTAEYSLANLVRFMKAVSPKVVCVGATAEESGVNIARGGTEHAGGDHVKEHLQLYASVLESLGGRCSNVSVEKALLGPRIRALVGARGSSNFFTHWCHLLQGAGFRECSMSATAHYQADIAARGFKAGFSVASHKNGALLLRWRGQPLATALSWAAC